MGAGRYVGLLELRVAAARIALTALLRPCRADDTGAVQAAVVCMRQLLASGYMEERLAALQTVCSVVWPADATEGERNRQGEGEDGGPSQRAVLTAAVRAAVLEYLPGERDAPCVEAALTLLVCGRSEGAPLVGSGLGAGAESQGTLWQLLVGSIATGGSNALRERALFLLGVLLKECSEGAGQPPGAAALQWVGLVAAGAASSQPVVVREAAARSIAAAGVLREGEVPEAEAEGRGQLVLQAWAALLALLQDDDEGMRWTAAQVVTAPASVSWQRSDLGATNSAGQAKDVSPFLVVRALGQAHRRMSRALWRLEAYSAWLRATLREHSVELLKAAVAADPAVTRRVFEKERENTHQEDLLCVQAAAAELQWVREQQQQEDEAQNGACATIDVLQRTQADAVAALQHGVGLLEGYCGQGIQDEPDARPLDTLRTGEVTYRATRVAFLAIFSLLVYARAAALGQEHQALVAQVAAFDPHVHPALGELCAMASGAGDTGRDPAFFLL